MLDYKEGGGVNSPHCKPVSAVTSKRGRSFLSIFSFRKNHPPNSEDTKFEFENNAVNRNLVCVINNQNNSYYSWTNKAIYNSCMINELLIWFKIKITDNCFNYVGGYFFK